MFQQFDAPLQPPMADLLSGLPVSPGALGSVAATTVLTLVVGALLLTRYESYGERLHSGLTASPVKCALVGALIVGSGAFLLVVAAMVGPLLSILLFAVLALPMGRVAGAGVRSGSGWNYGVAVALVLAVVVFAAVAPRSGPDAAILLLVVGPILVALAVGRATLAVVVGSRLLEAVDVESRGGALGLGAAVLAALTALPLVGLLFVLLVNSVAVGVVVRRFFTSAKSVPGTNLRQGPWESI